MQLFTTADPSRRRRTGVPLPDRRLRGVEQLFAAAILQIAIATLESAAGKKKIDRLFGLRHEPPLSQGEVIRPGREGSARDGEKWGDRVAAPSDFTTSSITLGKSPQNRPLMQAIRSVKELRLGRVQRAGAGQHRRRLAVARRGEERAGRAVPDLTGVTGKRAERGGTWCGCTLTLLFRSTSRGSRKGVVSS